MSFLVCAFGRVLGFLCGLFSKLLIGDFKVNLYLVTAADLYAINQTGQNHVFGLPNPKSLYIKPFSAHLRRRGFF